MHRAAPRDDQTRTQNPTPVTIWAATREGSRMTVPVASTLAKPYLLTSMINAADVLGAQPGAFALDRALQADQRRQPECGEQFDDMPHVLHVAAQQGARQPNLLCA